MTAQRNPEAGNLGADTDDAMLSDRSTTLYRAFDSLGRLLYVGISDSLFLRLGQHASSSGWAAHVTRLDLEYFQSREAAADAEASAIRDEDPVWNMSGRPMGRFMQWMAAYPDRNPDEVDPDAVARDTLALLLRGGDHAA